MHEMAGLVIGMAVQSRGVSAPNDTKLWRTMHLFANQRERRGRAPTPSVASVRS